MAKSQTATTHPKAAPNQLLSSAMATLASKLNSATIVKKGPRLIWRALPRVWIVPLSLNGSCVQGGFPQVTLGDFGGGCGARPEYAALGASVRSGWRSQRA
jgi:hypothetical protein